MRNKKAYLLFNQDSSSYDANIGEHKMANVASWESEWNEENMHK